MSIDLRKLGKCLDLAEASVGGCIKNTTDCGLITLNDEYNYDIVGYDKINTLLDKYDFYAVKGIFDFDRDLIIPLSKKQVHELWAKEGSVR